MGDDIIIDSELNYLKIFLTEKISSVFNIFNDIFSFVKNKFMILDTMYLKIVEFDVVKGSIDDKVNNIDNKVKNVSNNDIIKFFKNVMIYYLYLNRIYYYYNLFNILSKKEFNKKDIEILDLKLKMLEDNLKKNIDNVKDI